METQLRSMTATTHHKVFSLAPTRSSSSSSFSWSTSLLSFSSPTRSSLLLKKENSHQNDILGGVVGRNRRRRQGSVVVASSNVGATPFWDGWTPEKSSSSSAPSLSDILWPSAGAFAAMALLGKMDQILAPKGVSMTIAPLGAVCAVLFATPSSPGARKYNLFMAQIGCAAIGVLALSIFGPGWLARSAALSASIAFMIFTRSTHPPAASLPILFIDGAKLHHLNFWYALFPGAAGCVLLCLIPEEELYSSKFGQAPFFKVRIGALLFLVKPGAQLSTTESAISQFTEGNKIFIIGVMR
ncbi:hypothetical protein TIFTF001_014895 [Ficus carica]|uniref:HPP transmembrane region domain-containing protein n=1 Tax=Ficus carica TaxID=3494 RepID=A0AA88AKM1_FICCA|nr:hypothetical protein TIFTF001_014895 [Ficus carica]